MGRRFDSQSQHHIRVAFVGYLLYTERFFPGTQVFPSPQKPTFDFIWLFNLQCPKYESAISLEDYTQTNVLLLSFYNLHLRKDAFAEVHPYKVGYSSLIQRLHILITNRMWFNILCTLMDNVMHHHSRQNVVYSRGTTESTTKLELSFSILIVLQTLITALNSTGCNNYCLR